MVAFARKRGKKVVIAAAGRFFFKLNFRCDTPVGHDVWGQTALALSRIVQASAFEDVLTGRVIRAKRMGGLWTLPVADMFGQLPLALLEVQQL